MHEIATEKCDVIYLKQFPIIWFFMWEKNDWKSKKLVTVMKDAITFFHLIGCCWKLLQSIPETKLHHFRTKKYSNWTILTIFGSQILNWIIWIKKGLKGKSIGAKVGYGLYLWKYPLIIWMRQMVEEISSVTKDKRPHCK